MFLNINKSMFLKHQPIHVSESSTNPYFWIMLCLWSDPNATLVAMQQEGLHLRTWPWVEALHKKVLLLPAWFRVGYKNANWKKDSLPTQSTLLASTFNLQNLWGLKNKKFMMSNRQQVVMMYLLQQPKNVFKNGQDNCFRDWNELVWPKTQRYWLTCI